LRPFDHELAALALERATRRQPALYRGDQADYDLTLEPVWSRYVAYFEQH